MVIGVMDSGIGGLTTLSRMMKVCGGDYIFIRDNCSYGDKDDAFVLNRTFKACEKLKSRGASIIVLACNTATNVAIQRLRELDAGFNYIGVEPAVKPALCSCRNVAVALTPAAARQEKFRELIGSKSDMIKLITRAELAPEIERSYFDANELKSLARKLYTECRGCDGLVLGCTHYIFLKDYLYDLDPRMKIFDGNDGVARRLYRFTGKMGAPTVSFERLM